MTINKRIVRLKKEEEEEEEESSFYKNSVWYVILVLQGYIYFLPYQHYLLGNSKIIQKNAFQRQHGKKEEEEEEESIM